MQMSGGHLRQPVQKLVVSLQFVPSEQIGNRVLYHPLPYFKNFSKNHLTNPARMCILIKHSPRHIWTISSAGQSIRLTCGRSQVRVLYRPPKKNSILPDGVLFCCTVDSNPSKCRCPLDICGNQCKHWLHLYNLFHRNKLGIESYIVHFHICHAVFKEIPTTQYQESPALSATLQFRMLFSSPHYAFSQYRNRLMKVGLPHVYIRKHKTITGT